MKAGADMFIEKPHNSDVLNAYIKVGLRRMAQYQSESLEELRFDDLRVDLAQRKVFLGENQVTLKPNLYNMLEYLARNPGVALSNEVLLSKLWGDNDTDDVNTDKLRRCIADLREAIGDDAKKPRFIFTVPKFGYRFRERS
jgi:two-component system, OmpR family, KDP operon response regulator KdpE